MITLSKNGEDKLSIPFIPSKLKPLIYDSTLRDNKMYIGTIDDIITLKNTANESASKILIQFTGSSLTTVVVYK